MKRLGLIAITALALAAVAAIARPGTAEARVSFSDGVVMMSGFDCRDAYAYSTTTHAVGVSTTVFQSQPAYGHFRVWIWNHQTRSWIGPSAWRSIGTNTFLMYGTSAWMYGPGYFTLYAEFGRWVNGQWHSGFDYEFARTCYFIR